VSARDGQRGDDGRPADELRELTAVQRRAIEAASELFDRIIGEVAGRATPRLRVPPVDGLDADARAPLSELRATVARAIDLYADLFRETFELYADVVELGVLDRGPVSANGSPVALTGAPGDEAAAQVWIHNTTDSPLEAIALRVTDLAAHDGATVHGGLAAFAPARLDVAAGASASTMLALEVPERTAAGAYHGLVLASGLPAASVPVLLVVE
jgi:hypothetical protein